MTDCTRRQLLASGAALAAAGAARRAGAQPEHEHDHGSDRPAEDAPAAEAPAPQPTRRQKRLRAAGHTPVLAPDVPSLPWRIVGGVKVFHLVAQAFERTFTDGLEVACWGYNGHTPGPLIEAVEGERCRFYVTNELPEPTTVHWHGVILPSGMDGVGGLSQPVIEPGQTFVYEFTFQHPGTFLYHPHFDEMTQIALGMTGVIVVHPRRPRRTGRRVRDDSLMLHEWLIEAGTARPDPLAMRDFNVLTLNGKAFPGTTPLVAETGDLVRIRFGNLRPMNPSPASTRPCNPCCPAP